MPELMQLKDVPKEARILLLRELGYDSDGTFVLKNGQKFFDKYIKEPVRLDNMFIYPGSVIILDNNPLSIAEFFEEYGDVF